MNFQAYSADARWHHVSKLLFIMKLSIIIVICSILQVSATSFGQQITLKKNGISIKSLFKEIKRQTGYEVVYADRLLDDKKTVNAMFQAVPLRAVLDVTFQGLQVDFVIEERNIILSRKPQKGTEKKESASLDYEVKGMVTDENNKGIPGVTVKAATSASASARASSAQLLYTSTKVTNADGSFSMDLNERDQLLVFSYVGYETKVVKIDGQRYFKVGMEPSKNPLDEIQVIAYGTTTKRLSTGSISSVKSDQLEKQPVSNPLHAIAGRAAGVVITEASGVAGSSVSVQIRGQNSIGAGQQPLYIVDGVTFNGTATETTSGSYTTTTVVGGSFSPFDNIPTSDIESIDILKDADATAIYGSRGANGVVVITTKRGKSGSMKFNANVYSGISQLTRTIDYLNTEQYIDLRKTAFANDNIVPTAANAPDLISFGDGYTNFTEYLYGNTARFTDATFGVSGGTKLTQYLISANFRHQDAPFPVDFGDNKGTVRFNIQSQSENNKFSINFSGGYTKNVNKLPTTNILSFATRPPNLPLYNADGSFFWDNNYINPAAALTAPLEVKTDNVIANSTIKYNIIEGLSFKTDLGFNRINFESLKATTKASSNPNTTTTGTSIFQNTYNQVYSIEPQLNFVHPFAGGKLDVLIGGTYQATQYVEPYFIYGSFTNDLLYKDLTSVTPILRASGFAENKYASAFGRVNYNFENRYILNFTGRRDGSSRFGPGKRFGNFGSVGASWIFTEESFLDKQLSWLSFGKLRGSYGTVGNDQIQDYGYLSTYSTFSLYPSYNGVSGINPTGLANAEYSWEVTRKLEFGLDLNFLKNRIAFTVAWYKNRSANLLVSTPVASQTGFTSYYSNLPATIENTGWEFTLDTKNIQKGALNWSTSINLTLPQNKLLSFDGLDRSTYANTYVVGQPLSVVQNYHFTGFNESGIAQFQDLDGSGTITTGSYTTTGRGDYSVAGSTAPKFYGGVNNTFTYNGFQLDFLFQFVKKDGYNIYSRSAIPGNATNIPASLLELPFKPTTLTSGPVATAFNLYKASDAVFGDASFIRLKTVSLGYSFKNKMVRKIGMQNLMLYARGQNLLTFTKYIGIDPETMGTNIPPMKLFSLGLQTSF